jgi:uncharacterized protein YcbX
MPKLTHLTVFPIKSLDGLSLTSSELLSGGALQHDRRWALVDGEGSIVNGGKCQAIHKIRATFDEGCQQVTLSNADREATFSLNNEQTAIADWCGDVLGQTCQLVENREVGFPDDFEASGPTLVSTATLKAVAAWYEDLSLEEIRRRFRANLEIDADAPFWEDRLVGPHDEIRRFCIGDTVWHGLRICQRCVVPTRDAQSGVGSPEFVHQFSRRREATLPQWSPVDRFDHYYRLAVNTKLDSISGKPVLQVGDSVEAIEDMNLAHHQ